MLEILYTILVVLGTHLPGIIIWVTKQKQNHYTTRFIGLTFTLYAFLMLVFVGCLFTNTAFTSSDIQIPCGVIWFLLYCCIPAFILLTYRTILFVEMYRAHNLVILSDFLDKFFRKSPESELNEYEKTLSRKVVPKVGTKQYLIVLSLSIVTLLVMFGIGIFISGPSEMARFPNQSSICDYQMAIVLLAFIVFCLSIQIYCMWLLRNCKDGLGISIELMVMLVIALPSYLIFVVVVFLSSNDVAGIIAPYVGLVPTYFLMTSILYFPEIFMWITTLRIKEQSKFAYPYFEQAFSKPDARKQMEEIAKKRLCSELTNFMKVFDEMEKIYLLNGVCSPYRDLGQIIIAKYLADTSEEQVCLNEDVVVRIMDVPREEAIPFEYWLIAKKDVLYMIYENIYKYYVET
eukprot:NODE_73_length_24441_cov_0.672952.p6 type:complete len:403 gc:universal NODE_73_length_24441_cov_0.672952:16888-18096(+)